MTWHRHISGRRSAAFFVAAAAALAPAAPAPAQFGDLAGFTEAMHPEYLSRDLVIVAEALELDKAQREVLESLYADYKKSFDAGLQAMQGRLEDMRTDLQTGDQKRILSMIFVPFEDWAKERRRMGGQFLQNIDIILSEQQKTLVPSFRRRMVREKTLSRGVLSGESLDLTLLVKQLDLDEQQKRDAAPLVTAYEIALHEALEKRNRILDDSQAKAVQALQEQDADRTVELIGPQIAARVAIRKVNDQHLELITAALPPELSGEFRANALTRAYGTAFRTTQAERMFAAAVELELEAGMLESIVDLRDLYMSELDFFRQHLIDVIREWEPQRERNRVEMSAQRMKGEDVVRLADPTLAEHRQRETLDDQYIGMLQSLLSTEEFALLPGSERWLTRRSTKDAGGEKIASRDSERKALEQRRKIRELREGGTPGGLGTSGDDGAGGAGGNGSPDADGGGGTGGTEGGEGNEDGGEDGEETWPQPE